MKRSFVLVFGVVLVLFGAFIPTAQTSLTDLDRIQQARTLIAGLTSTDQAVQDEAAHADGHLATLEQLLTPGPPPPTTSGLNFSTYLGGSSPDSLRDIAIDSAGNIYAVGGTQSANFPTTLGPAFDSGACSTLGSGGRMDVFVTKFTPAGQLVWSRFLGGPCYDRAYAVEVDASGNVYVGGRAGAGFPTTAGSLQPTFGGDSVPNGVYGSQDGFIAKLDSAGAVLWATYFGGNDMAIIRDIAVDASGNVYPVLQGVTVSLPHVTPGTVRTTLLGGEDIVIAKLTASGQLVWGTYYGGSGLDGQGSSIRVDSQGQPIVLGITNSSNLMLANAAQPANAGGFDFALAKFTADGSALIFSTYLGGGADEGVETHHLGLDANDNIFLAGIVRSANFPATAGAFTTVRPGGVDVGVAKFSPSGTLLAATYFGSTGTDGVQGVSVDPAGNVVFSGTTTSTTIATSNAWQSTLSGSSDMYVVKLSADLSTQLYTTYFGGSNGDQGRSNAVLGDVIVFGGHAESNDYPLKNAYDTTFNGGGYDVGLTSITVK